MSLDFTPDLQSNLKDLHDYYQKLVDHANSQLAHVQALLQSPVNPTISAIPEEESVVKEIPSQAAKRRIKPAIFSPSIPVPSPVANTSSKGKARTKTTTKIKPSSILPLLPAYQGLTLLTAIAQVLKNYEGEKVNADTVVKELHGDLSLDKFRIAKDRVTKNLSKGKLENRWESVPDQTGLYTISLSKLN